MSAASESSSIEIAGPLAAGELTPSVHFSKVVSRRADPVASSGLSRVVAIRDSFQSFQQRVNSAVKQFASAFFVFVFEKILKTLSSFSISFLMPLISVSKPQSQTGQRHACMKRKIVLSKCCDQFREILDSLLTANKYLHAA